MPTDLASVRQANIDLLNLYANAVHKRDWPSMADLFTLDAIFSARRTLGFGGGEDGAFSVETRDKIVEVTAQLTASLSETHILISNYIVDASTDGAAADVSCYFRAYHAGKGKRAHLFEESLGRFELKTIKVGSSWKIHRLDETIMIMVGTAEVFETGH